MEATAVPPAAAEATGINRAAPLGTDDGVTYHYLAPMPDVDVKLSQPFAAYMPHLQYLYYSGVTTNKRGGKTVYVNPYRGCSMAPRLQLCTEEQPMWAPFGMCVAKTKGPDGSFVECGDASRPNLDLSIESDILREFLLQWDAKNLSVAQARRTQWFGPRVKPEAISTLYKPLVTMPAAPKPGESAREYKPVLRTKMVLEGPHATRVFVRRGANEMEPASAEQLRKENIGAYMGCIPIVDAVGLWFMASQFGLTLQVTDILLIPRPVRPSGTFLLSSGVTMRVRSDEADEEARASSPDTDAEADAKAHMEP